MLQAVEATTPVPAAEVPAAGNFYSAQHPNWPPLPGNIDGVPCWPLDTNMFLLDDLAVNYAMPLKQASTTEKMMAMDVPSPGGGGSGGSGGLSGSSYSPANTNFLIGLRGTNIVLNWLSSTGRIYLLEDRPTLTGGTQWSVVTNYFLAAANTNRTTFVHSNILQSQPMNFYRLFDVTPVPHNDVFGIDQNSSGNQLDIFQNDSDPNGDPIFISGLVPAHHGNISYTLDASTFQYTPVSGFYGVDSFAYSVTSGYGDTSSNATVTVFVNQSGNQPPSAPDISITLQTNVYTATFNALTNATDPNGDTNTLFSVNPPSLGSVSNDASGNITYTRNPNLFGSDAFTYIVTDGKGGYAVGNVKILQQNTSGDSLSDQWDLRYGFNPTVDNSMADPDGDGLPNLAEFVLGTNPNVPDNPLNFSGLANGTQVSGFAQLPIFGLNPAFQTFPIILYVNGLPAQNSLLSQGPDGQWLMNWDTTFLTNGNYQIQLGLQINPPTLPASFTNILGSQKTVQVNNPLTFDRLTSQFNNFLLIYATLAVTNSTYDAYLYDDAGNLLVYALGLTAPNGQIQLYWDLTDGNGHQISFGNIQAFFTIHPPAGLSGMQPNAPSGPSSASHWFLKDTPNVDQNVFAVAWGWDNYLTAFYNYRTELMQDGVINILANPSDFSSYTLLPAANIAYGGSTFRYDDEADRSVLIGPARNGTGDFGKSGSFFWFGHGGELGDDFICGNPDRSNITANDVENDLQNKAFRSTSKLPKTNKHPYRLTILNACDTYTPGWAGAFGVDFSANGSLDSAANYAAVGRSQRAFVGWTKKIGVPGGNDLFFGGLLDAEYAQALGYLFGDWMAGYPLNYCMSQFSSSALNSEPTYFQNQDSWKISGCYDLERNDQ